ncbi:MAG: ribosomal RNA small subunit methyltransferase A [Bacilli bacterium]|nr:ribosomal RNA small subunit methyltransferase A [Bacilli bacterium]
METFHFKKKYGQNFLTDTNLVKKIVDAACIEKNSLVIEVGPGRAILTKQLSKVSGSVLSYEIDLELQQYLKEGLQDYNNVDVIFDDFLKRDIEKDIQKYNKDFIYFVSNVPYYITTPILIKLLDSKIDFTKIVIMVQEEVGERFSAKPGNKSYGSITVLLNYYYHIKREFKVNRKMFTPEPKVDSEIVSLTKRKNRIPLKNKRLFFQLIRDSFQYKRKNIRNNLKQYNLEKIEQVLVRYGFDLTDRSEKLPVEVFIEICNHLD